MNAPGLIDAMTSSLTRLSAKMVRMGRDGFYSVEEPNPWMLIKAVQQLKSEHDRLKSENDRERSEIKVLLARLHTIEEARR